MGFGMRIKIWRSRLALFSPYAVLLLSLFATAISASSINHYIRREKEERLETAAMQIRQSIINRLQRYENSLMQMRAHFVTASEINREGFKLYVESLMLLERYPGIQGLGYTVRLRPEELSEHISKTRSEGYPSYRVWPGDKRDEYFSIIYLEPFDWRNQRALGYDMFTEPVRREAMSRARDSGLPALSGKVKLVQETGDLSQPGFLMYVPVYKTGITPSTVEGRRESLAGFVYSPFRSQDLFDAIFLKNLTVHRHLDVEIYDGDNPSKEALLYDNESLFEKIEDGIDTYRITKYIEIAGRKWAVLIRPRPSFALSSERFAPLVFWAGGTIFSFLLFWIVFSGRRFAAKETASKETLEKINQVSRTIAGELDLQALLQSVTDAATSVSRAEFGAFFYNVVNSDGESYMLYTLSGVKREAFANFPMPRNTKVFAPTFTGAGVVRSDDITRDPRYGENAPYKGMPTGHLPVKSYLAVPVISRSGEVLGGLFLGHKEIGVFGEQEEAVVQGIASYAAVAIDNSRLYQTSLDAVRARDRFLSICSHELKTPITSLKLQAQITKRHFKKSGRLDPRQVSEMVDNMDQQLNQLARLVEDMLDTARIETGRFSLNMEELDLSELVKEVVARFSPQARNAGVEVGVTADVPAFVCADPDRITQVIMNLLSNALKYGDGKPIGVNASIERGRAKVSVRDQGMGIADKDRGRIFDRFERVVSHQNISGMGLGLFISRQIMEAHKGEIHVESMLGGGSIFTIELPISNERFADTGRVGALKDAEQNSSCR